MNKNIIKHFISASLICFLVCSCGTDNSDTSSNKSSDVSDTSLDSNIS